MLKIVCSLVLTILCTRYGAIIYTPSTGKHVNLKSHGRDSPLISVTGRAHALSLYCVECVAITDLLRHMRKAWKWNKVAILFGGKQQLSYPRKNEKFKPGHYKVTCTF